MLSAPSVQEMETESRVTVPLRVQVMFTGTSMPPEPISMKLFSTFDKLPLVGLVSTTKVAVYDILSADCVMEPAPMLRATGDMIPHGISYAS